MDCGGYIEPCHGGECDGLDEVVALLPSGRIWNPDRESTYGSYIKALGDIKTELNKRLCQEWLEFNPCTSVRLFDYWAGIYSFPKCVEQTGEKLCEWIALVQGDCPIGSLGFLRAAVEFVLPGEGGVSINVNVPDAGASPWRADNPCADANPIVITAPPSFYYYQEVYRDEPHENQDGETCNVYFIPEIECLRRCVFPFGLGIGYKTDPVGPLAQDIYGVPVENVAALPSHFINCNPTCEI